MNKKIYTSSVFFLLIATILIHSSPVMASEITGVLSSDTSNTNQLTGGITGTVTDDTDGRSSSGGTRTRNNTDNNPPGAVLGASTVAVAAPAFPNAGAPALDAITSPTLWSVLITFLAHILHIR
jgi:hypothetical protein